MGILCMHAGVLTVQEDIRIAPVLPGLAPSIEAESQMQTSRATTVAATSSSSSSQGSTVRMSSPSSQYTPSTSPEVNKEEEEAENNVELEQNQAEIPEEPIPQEPEQPHEDQQRGESDVEEPILDANLYQQVFGTLLPDTRAAIQHLASLEKVSRKLGSKYDKAKADITQTNAELSETKAQLAYKTEELEAANAELSRKEIELEEAKERQDATLEVLEAM